MNDYRLVSRKSFFGNLRVNVILILVNVAVFFFLSLFPGFLSYFALSPSNILQGKFIWTLFTSMFSHVAFVHLAFNMISLFFVGTLVERIIGPRRYLIFYLISGTLAGAVFVLLSGFLGNSEIGAKLFGDPTILGVGASGAIFGLIGMLVILIPKKRVYLIAGPLIAIILQIVIQTMFPNMPFLEIIYFLLTAYVVASVFLMFSFNPRLRKFILPLQMPFWLLPVIAIVPLAVVSLFVQLPIGNSAHLGGLLIGLVYGFYLKQRFPRKTEMVSRFFSR